MVCKEEEEIVRKIFEKYYFIRGWIILRVVVYIFNVFVGIEEETSGT